MIQSSSIIFLYAAAVFSVMAAYIFYLQFSFLKWDESEIRLLERLELHLAHVLRLLEAPDMQMLLRKPESRQRLFLDFSSYLKDDVVELLRSRKIGGATLVFVCTFFLSYYLMRVKARVICGRNDLRFLSGLELVLCRRLEKIESS